jgi:hypothetical protein
VKKRPIALFTQREAARALEITAPRLARAVRRGAIRPDFIANAATLFLPATIKAIARGIACGRIFHLASQ